MTLKMYENFDFSKKVLFFRSNYWISLVPLLFNVKIWNIASHNFRFETVTDHSRPGLMKRESQTRNIGSELPKVEWSVFNYVRKYIEASYTQQDKLWRFKLVFYLLYPQSKGFVRTVIFIGRLLRRLVMKPKKKKATTNRINRRLKIFYPRAPWSQFASQHIHLNLKKEHRHKLRLVQPMVQLISCYLRTLL